MSGMTTERIERLASPDGYRVWDSAGNWLGDVLRRFEPSHIRRGRAQVSPWWLPVASNGTALAMEQTRKAAIDALRFQAQS